MRDRKSEKDVDERMNASNALISELIAVVANKK